MASGLFLPDAGPSALGVSTDVKNQQVMLYLFILVS